MHEAATLENGDARRERFCRVFDDRRVGRNVFSKDFLMVTF
jgi:hypothetical protein